MALNFVTWLGAAAFYSLMAAGLTCLVAANLARPFRDIIAVLHQIKKGCYDRRVRVVSNDETGGDYFDDIKRETAGGTRLATVIGDASRHGISAALLMTSIRALLRSRAGSSGGPREIVCRLNGQSSQDTEETGQFVTLVVIKFLSVQCPSRNGGFNSLARLER